MNISRPSSILACALLFNASIPLGAVTIFGKPILDFAQDVRTNLAKRPKPFHSRTISADEQSKRKGKTGECPYYAGQAKWDVMYKGVDVNTGNYTASITDLTFANGYGIPVSVTRSYSANDGNDGPFGKGWELSADMRSTMGGKKSKNAPVRAVPTTYKERNTAEVDPNVIVQPVAAVTATDSTGREETIQRDIDGVLTTPPWDNNVSNPTYTYVTFGGASYQVETGNTTATTDGTVYTYATEGSYPSGTVPYGSATGAQPANVLKVVAATDRQGNVTHFNYGSGTVTFNKIDGATVEHPLTSVAMPNGHTITFTWGNGSTEPTNKIVTVSDGTRSVHYHYVGGLLATVTDPMGYVTTYGYAAPINGGSSDFLSSITDPRGLVTTIRYMVTPIQDTTWNNGVTWPMNNAISVERIIWPSGVVSGFYPNYPRSTPRGYLPADNPYSVYAPYAAIGVVNADSSGNFIDGFSYTSNGGMNQPTVTNTFFALHYGDAFADGSEETGISNWQIQIDVFDTTSENLLNTEKNTYYIAHTVMNSSLAEQRALYTAPAPGGISEPYINLATIETFQYNFMGNKLSDEVVEYAPAEVGQGPFGRTVTRDATTQYAYWDGSKYFQQKIVKDSSGRYNYTDYLPNTAAAGSRGQMYQVFDAKNGGFRVDGSITVPGYAASFPWKYNEVPTAGDYTVQYAYDSVGRCTDTWQLHSTTSTPWTYVHSQTGYGTDTDGSWGQAHSVTEDVGGVNRVTNTLSYTAWGDPSSTRDGAGHQFNTSYDLDGNILTVTRVDSGLNQMVASYQYGTSGISTGQPLTVTDGLTGVADTITYQASGPGIGQPSQTAESVGGVSSYNVLYTYNSAGERATSKYTTPNGTKFWSYSDYIQAGDCTGLHRSFQTLTLLDSSGNPTAEQIQYAYDTSGRLISTGYAQTPQSGFTPTGSNPWYDATHLPASRARTFYTFDAGGRALGVQNYWDTHSGSWTSEGISENVCQYETSGLNRGLKTSSSFYTNSTPGTVSWVLARTETFGYDASLDYLTGASYGDGLANANPTWSYDAAGNRTDSVVDNLNRPTQVNGVTSTSDIMGNRLALGTQSYGWDCLNRMTSYGSSASYVYRADGLRTSKTVSGTTTKYFYDGQMGIEDQDGTATVTDYGLGARGVDYISRLSGGVTTTGFPIYDAHGSMTACVFRSGSSYSVANQRTYDAWGGIRSGGSTGDPKGRYCANLGHKQDDESGLIYMRARYYEPSSGRYISEDPERNGSNFFCYCGNQPITRSDSTGKDWVLDLLLLLKSITQMIGDVGLSGVLKLVAMGGARTASALCSAVGGSLIGLGMDLNTVAEGLAESGSYIGRMAGAAAGWAGAKCIAAGIECEEMATMLMLFADDGGDDGLGGGDNPEFDDVPRDPGLLN